MRQTRTEEIWNATSHGIGSILSFFGFFILMTFNTKKTPYSTFSLTIYAITLFLLYTASTLYHYTEEGKKKDLWQKIDHISIYLLIAGTYTPLALITLENSSGWLIFYIVWSIAVIGILLEIFLKNKYAFIPVLLYLSMGWMIVFYIKDLLVHITPSGLTLLLLGGGLYTVGVFFYSLRRIPYNHVIWHFFVLGGSISHFFFILLDVI